MRVASGVSFPPMEFFDTDNKTVLGFDADLGKALGQVLGVKFDFQNTNFDGIIGGLNAGRYDLALTSMIDKKARQATVDFVDYLNSGVTFMVAKGNPKGLKDKLDLCGKTAAVEKSSTGDLSVDDITKACKAAGQARRHQAALPRPGQCRPGPAVRPCRRGRRARPDPGLQRQDIAPVPSRSTPSRSARCRSASRCPRRTRSCATPSRAP